MKKAFLLVFMVLGIGSMQGEEKQPTKPKSRPPHVKTAIRHHIYIGILSIIAMGCGYKFLLPRLQSSKAQPNQKS